MTRIEDRQYQDIRENWEIRFLFSQIILFKKKNVTIKETVLLVKNKRLVEFRDH